MYMDLVLRQLLRSVLLLQDILAIFLSTFLDEVEENQIGMSQMAAVVTVTITWINGLM